MFYKVPRKYLNRTHMICKRYIIGKFRVFSKKR